MQTNKSNPSENLIIFQIVTLMKAVATHDPFKDVPIFSLIYHPSRCLAGGSFVTSPEAFNRKKSRISSDLAITHLTHRMRSHFGNTLTLPLAKSNPKEWSIIKLCIANENIC